MRHVICGMTALVVILGPVAALGDEKKPVRTIAEIEPAFELAASSASSNSDVIDIGCDDSDEDVAFCATDFADACNNHGGGMSTNPDGSVTCSILKEAKTTTHFFTVEVADAHEFQRALNLKARRTDGAALITHCSPGGNRFCTSGGFAKACDQAGGGMSTNPDGSVSCHVP